MPELYLRLLARILGPFLIALTLFLLLRGHNLPGGGFIAGLLAAATLELQILSTGDQNVRQRIGRFLQPGIGVGLLIAMFAALIGGVAGQGIFQGIWWKIPIGPLVIDLGTPVIFDIGVFITVVGVTTSYLLGLSQAAERR
jgi:multicomponent Na+:H+ antiporter subunit B